jgi:hypothetical protein
MDVNELEKHYDAFSKKYKLPEFKGLNEDFEIEKIKRRSGILIKTIRKVMMEKIINSMSFLEMLLNPVSAPRVYLIYIKSMTSEDKTEIDRIYGVLSEVVLNSLELEIEYSEKREAEMINEICKKWNSVKHGFIKIIKDLKKPASSVVKEKSYFG